jgi:hypothetical protein
MSAVYADRIGAVFFDFAIDAQASAHRSRFIRSLPKYGSRKRKTSERGPNEKPKSRRRRVGESDAKTANLLFAQ